MNRKTIVGKNLDGRKVGLVVVSTIRKSNKIDLSKNENYETAVFHILTGKSDVKTLEAFDLKSNYVDIKRYKTKEEAEEGHKKMVEKWKARLNADFEVSEERKCIAMA